MDSKYTAFDICHKERKDAVLKGKHYIHIHIHIHTHTHTHTPVAGPVCAPARGPGAGWWAVPTLPPSPRCPVPGPRGPGLGCAGMPWAAVGPAQPAETRPRHQDPEGQHYKVFIKHSHQGQWYLLISWSNGLKVSHICIVHFVWMFLLYQLIYYVSSV